MKIFSVSQIRAWDAFTIANEPIQSLDLMERASCSFVKWFCERFDDRQCVKIFCGMGNNGGDGLAIGRLLLQKHYNVQVFIVKHSDTDSPDFRENLTRLQLQTHVHWIENASSVPDLSSNDYVIDALLGSGLSRPAEGILADVIQAINGSHSMVISVDIASGLFADAPNSPLDAIVKPAFTVSFQCPKLAFFQPQCGENVGEWHVVNIDLHPDYERITATSYFYTAPGQINSLSNPRKKYSHKGSFGHALLIGGSYGKMGAIVLSAKACLRSGVGLLTVQIPRCGYDILQTSLPEAMVLPDWHWMVNTTVPDVSSYSALGIGPGLGKDSLTLAMLKELFPTLTQPVVLDADALNLISENPDLLHSIPKNAILTPHPKEFQRLLGNGWKDDYEKLDFLRDFAQKHQLIVCLKGAHTAVALPDGSIHFNSSGNPGMATGGSGDVLTGILTGLLAQGLPPAEAAIFGVYQHGAAGDRAAQKCTQPGLIASDIINEMGW
ncbi:NAD(P)H-hydrate dehydratase [Runella sp.]|jgi:ADP-dependent NAD(P)H-hydrate dehydratase / NAD(P)H-hydrate epimerase|uniref:NAD(P)H-hydrate dehydratase n=1 Tax=Runella sp. TaxID=1960881 RepID=UPI00262929A0|nr:NAD(P)H-hydrate dehydratase [Runella sp.]